MPETILLQEALDWLADLDSTRPGFLRDIASEFDRDCPKSIEKLTSAQSRGDAESLWRAAHHLKGSSGVVGAARMTAVCDRLETQGRAGQLEGLESEIPQLRREFESASAALHHFIHSKTR